jgi:hypothetical protein
MAVCRGGGSDGIKVCFLVVVMGEVVEGLNIWVGERVKADFVVTGAVEIFKDVESRFVMLVTWIGAVGGKEGECRSNVGPGASCQPINTSHDCLITFGSSFVVIWILGVRRSNGVNGHS